MADVADPAGLAQRLEHGELVYYPICPFALPSPEDRAFLAGVRQGAPVHKNISYDPTTGRVAGHARCPADAERRLRQLLAAFSHAVTAWLGTVLPGYRSGWRLDRATFRPLEEATRPLRHRARNDLLHIDSFPTRPSHGWRLLRAFVNISAAEPRVWVTSETFPRLLERYGPVVGRPAPAGPLRRAARRLLGLPPRPAFDEFMLRLHHFLKESDEFQERSGKRVWVFPPGSMWMLMSDGLSHAELRGRYALEHSYFIAPETLALPELSPAALAGLARVA
jgi:hypothetical protein